MSWDGQRFLLFFAGANASSGDPLKPAALVLTLTTDETVDPPLFSYGNIDTANIAVGWIVELQHADNVDFTGAVTDSLTVSASDIAFEEFTWGDDEAAMSAWGNGTWYARVRYGPSGHLSDWSNVETVTISTFEAESEAIFAAFTTPPDDTRKGLIDDFVVALKTATTGDVWAKLDWLYMHAAADSQAALVNWINPGTYDGTANNSPTFTADRGFNGNGSNAYIDTGFNPATAGGHFAQNSCSIGSWMLTVNGNNYATLGMADASVNAWHINPHMADPSVRFVMGAAAVQITGAGSGTGLMIGSRTAANLTTGYVDGVSVGTSATASAAIPSLNLYVLARNFNGAVNLPTSQRCALSFAGGGLSADDAAVIYAAANTYLQAVGAV